MESYSEQEENQKREGEKERERERERERRRDSLQGAEVCATVHLRLWESYVWWVWLIVALGVANSYSGCGR